MGERPIFEANLTKARNAVESAPVEFVVGSHHNKKGESLGTLALMRFAIANDFSVGQAIALFGEYVDEVGSDPDGNSHPNIRALFEFTEEQRIVDVVGFPNQ